MDVYWKLKKIYPDLEDADVVLVRTGGRDKIVKWNDTIGPQPTEAEIDAIPDSEAVKLRNDTKADKLFGSKKNTEALAIVLANNIPGKTKEDILSELKAARRAL